MRILFDQGTPGPIREFLKNHIVKTAAELGWETLSNGDLLDSAEKAGFELLLTTDKNLIHQQNIQGRSIKIVVIGNAQWPVLRDHVQLVVNAINAANEGQYYLVEIPGK